MPHFVWILDSIVADGYKKNVCCPLQIKDEKPTSVDIFITTIDETPLQSTTGSQKQGRIR